MEQDREYVAFLHKDRKSDFGVSFPDFPGCVTAGKTLDEARRLAPEALALHIRGMVEDGEPIPKPSTLDDLSNDPAMKHAVAFLVSVEVPDGWSASTSRRAEAKWRRSTGGPRGPAGRALRMWSPPRLRWCRVGVRDASNHALAVLAALGEIPEHLRPMGLNLFE